ncbi:MAG: FGGY-family carbohydrate kinase [Pseudomonadota bacterium]
MTLSLGIDVGTSGVRTAVLDGADVVSSAQADHPKNAKTGIDAMDWWRAVETCLVNQSAALRDLGRDPAQIGRIAIDATSGSMVLVDAAGDPASPGLMYNSKDFDAEAARIRPHADADHITQGSNSALARAMRLQAMATGTPVRLLHQADFIQAQLTGLPGTSDYNNALKTGFDPHALTWPKWIGQVFDADLLPPVVAPGQPIATVSRAIANRFGLSPHAVVCAGTTDSIAAFMASAPFDLGVAVTSLGSTLAIKVLSSARIDDPACGLYSHRLGDFWLVGGASNTGGAVLKQLFSDQDLRDLSAQIDPMQDGDLGYYPLPKPGERFPINDPDMQPILSPVPDTQPAFLHALFEAIARIEAQCFAAVIQRGGPKPTQILTAGGGAQNPVWTVIRAKHLGLTPTAPNHSDASIGAAKLAAGMFG